MTDQTRWGIDLIHTKNKAIKRQKDIINKALSEVDKLEEQYIVDLMMEIEAIYESKYGNNEAQNTKHKILWQIIKNIFLSPKKSVQVYF